MFVSTIISIITIAISIIIVLLGPLGVRRGHRLRARRGDAVRWRLLMIILICILVVVVAVVVVVVVV